MTQQVKAVLKAVVNPLKSRKVRVAINTVVAAYLAQKQIEVSDDIVYAIVGLGTAVVLGIAIEDNGAKKANATEVAAKK